MGSIPTESMFSTWGSAEERHLDLGTGTDTKFLRKNIISKQSLEFYQTF